MGKMKVGSKKLPMLTGVLVGVATCVITMILGAALAAALILNETVGQAATQYMNVAIHVPAAAAGAVLSATLVGHKKFLVCAMTTGGYLIVLLLMNAVCFGGVFQGVAAVVLAMSAGMGLAILLLHRKKGGRKKYKAPTYR